MMHAADRREQTKDERAYYSLSGRFYATFAPFYDAATAPFRKLRREVADRVVPGPDAMILDVATGTGAQALAFAGKARAVVGIDLSDAMLSVARRKNRFANVTFQKADATSLPFEDASFDASCVSFALHEMPSSVRERVVREMARVTKPGGTVTIVDYGLPQNRAASFLVYHVISLYERPYYASFVRCDLDALLASAGVDALEDRPALLGAARIITGRKRATVS